MTDDVVKFPKPDDVPDEQEPDTDPEPPPAEDDPDADHQPPVNPGG